MTMNYEFIFRSEIIHYCLLQAALIYRPVTGQFLHEIRAFVALYWSVRDVSKNVQQTFLTCSAFSDQHKHKQKRKTGGCWSWRWGMRGERWVGVVLSPHNHNSSHHPSPSRPSSHLQPFTTLRQRAGDGWAPRLDPVFVSRTKSHLFQD